MVCNASHWHIKIACLHTTRPRRHSCCMVMPQSFAGVFSLASPFSLFFTTNHQLGLVTRANSEMRNEVTSSSLFSVHDRIHDRRDNLLHARASATCNASGS